MRRACGTAYVGRSIPLEPVLNHRDWKPFYSHEYCANLITRLTSVDHTEACFKAGMSIVFKEHRGIITSWLNMLECTTESGHDLATYVFSLALYKSNSGAANDATAWRLLRKLEGDKEVPAAKTARWKKQTYAWRHRAIRVVLQHDLVLPRRATRPALPLLASSVPC